MPLINGKMRLEKNALKTLEEIKKDCLALKRKKDLTEYGEGQLDLIFLITKRLLKGKRKR